MNDMKKMRPMCQGCGKTPDQIDEYVHASAECGIDADQYVMEEEGTFNQQNGHFLCTACYIEAGEPSGPSGWVAP